MEAKFEMTYPMWKRWQLWMEQNTLVNEAAEDPDSRYHRKGAASASYYLTPAFRSMGDVDFLVKTEDVERAGKVLEEHGLKPWDQEHISHIVYRGPRMHYEMHFNLAGTLNGTVGELVREYTKDIFEKAETRSIVSGIAMLPSPFHHGLILLLHTCHHLTGEGVGLRHLCDWAVFENTFSEAEFREIFEEKLKAIGLWRFAQIFTRTSIKYLGADERSWAVIKRAFLPMGVIKEYYPMFNKYKILLPFLPLYRLIYRWESAKAEIEVLKKC